MSNKNIQPLLEKVFEKSGLGKWFNKESAGGGPGWDRYNTKGERVGKCGDAEEGESYSACLSKQKAKKLGKENIGSFVRRKRSAQKKAGRGTKGSVKGKGKKPVFVKTGVTEVKECFDSFLVESSAKVFEMSFMPVEANDLLPCDIVINESGQIFDIDYIFENNGNLLIGMTDLDGNEFEENFNPSTIMGFIDNVEGQSYTEYGDRVEVYEETGGKVKLNKIMRGDVKKYKVYVKNDKGNVVKVNFGDPNMEIKRDDPNRRKNFRARHNCDNPGPRWKARYWACKTWSSKPVSAMLKEDIELLDEAKKNKPKDPKKWASCIAQAKKKFDVYPSAYANAWASKCYKSKGGKWKAMSEDISDNVVKSINEKKYNPNLYGLLKETGEPRPHYPSDRPSYLPTPADIWRYWRDTPFGMNPRPEKDRAREGYDYHFEGPFGEPMYPGMIPSWFNDPFATPVTGPHPYIPHQYPFGVQPQNPNTNI
jgi:hypothetical protein